MIKPEIGKLIKPYEEYLNKGTEIEKIFYEEKDEDEDDHKTIHGFNKQTDKRIREFQ